VWNLIEWFGKMGSRLRSRLKKERGLRAPGNDDFAEVISKLTVPPNEPVIDKSVDYRAFCLQTTTKRKIKIFAQWDK